VLVEYTECLDDRGRTRRRAYYLAANQDRLSAGRRPRFLDPILADGLTPIPIRSEPVPADGAAPDASAYAILEAGGAGFSLGGGPRPCGPFWLPVYEAGPGPAWRAAATPFAAVADAAWGGLIAAGVGLLLFDWTPAVAQNEGHSATSP
jgi:hypothetical protein